jgi:hypothetical protein
MRLQEVHYAALLRVVLVSIPLVIANAAVSVLIASPLLVPLGYSIGYHGLPYLPGEVLVGLAAALFTEWWFRAPALPVFDARYGT